MLTILKTAVRAIRRNILRSFLTMLGIIVGIAAVIVGVSMGTGAKAEVDRQIADMGNNLLIVFSGNFSRGGARRGFGMQPNLTERDYQTLRREVPGIAGRDVFRGSGTGDGVEDIFLRLKVEVVHPGASGQPYPVGRIPFVLEVYCVVLPSRVG